MKLRCDGQSPCGSCQKRNLECNNERTAGPSIPEYGEGTPAAPIGVQQGTIPIHAGPPVKPQSYEPPSSDRGSIKFLLNGGTDSFTENFRLPPRSDRARSLNYHHRVDMEEAQRSGFSYIKGQRPEYSSSFVGADPAAPLAAPDTFLDFLNVPFANGMRPAHDSYNADGINLEGAVYPPSGSGLHDDHSIFEPERPFAMALTQAILARAWQVPLDAKAQAEVTADFNFFLTTARIRKCIFLYFKYWQPSCAYVHSSFDPETAPLPLLAAIVFMGAMYSGDERECFIAKRILDFVELFVFSNDVFSADSEVSTIFSGNRCHIGEKDDWTKFQNFQAGFIILTVQYWSGHRVSRYRALETRFTELVKVARRMELTKIRHDAADHVTEDLWIQKELLFSFINTHMTLLGPFIGMGIVKKPTQDSNMSSRETSPIPEDSILTAIRAALGRWHEHWGVLTNRISSEEWASMGFYKNGYNFWLVSQMLITKKDAVDVVMRMEVNCEDKLDKLKVLLRDDQDEV
ncbi:uncharacterized protein N7511_008322 [Penicillium nucicola]|uniref:uncharacterized protein n=1 Tax=Penicillium nucicola TaxID=1850975 RepID=UPI00254561D7|nr:uncharacterized protein N7511_008322 [Penicillium nucicola]KAJ5754169.1 hypothetical protein N7511_008322 [Penicillium nucicola]